MTSGFEMTSTILTSCQTYSVQCISSVLQSQCTLPCRPRSANQGSTGCCLEFTADEYRREEGGRGVWGSGLCTKKCPNKIFPIANFVEGGGRVRGVCPLAPRCTAIPMLPCPRAWPPSLIVIHGLLWVTASQQCSCASMVLLRAGEGSESAEDQGTRSLNYRFLA